MSGPNQSSIAFAALETLSPADSASAADKGIPGSKSDPDLPNGGTDGTWIASPLFKCSRDGRPGRFRRALSVESQVPQGSPDRLPASVPIP